uniref:Kunitz peptide n=1 Tax=Calliophis bivirgatus TaxID=8633 RepID=A0A898IPM9_CALBG|nr:kunitz peptide [Calliophis bivirgatus]
MSSGGLLLLLGFLTLWAELTPSMARPRFCNLPPDTGRCLALMTAFYYHPASNTCRPFLFGGCKRNPNSFKTIKKCKRTCAG